MYYYLLDSDFRIILGIEKFQSMIWNEKYDEIGDFELYIPATEDFIKIFTEAAEKHYYIIRTSDAKTNELTDLPAMMVETVKTDISVKNGNFLIVKGSQLKKILYRRIALYEEEVDGNIVTALYSLVNSNAASPKDEDRRIPRLMCDPNIDPKVAEIAEDMFINFRLNGEFISKIITNACKTLKLGWDVVLDYNSGMMKFKLTTGVNRTQNQKGDLSTWNSPVVFSVKNSNLIKTTYSLDYENYRNIALVKSKYEMLNQKKEKETLTNIKEVTSYKIDRRPVGLDRYEIFVDGKEYTLSQDQEEIDLGVMNDQAKASGQSKLTSYLKKIDVSGEIDPGVTFEYGKDYFLGDLVLLQNEFGQSFEARITSVISTLSYNKCSTIPNFVIENYTGKESDDQELLNDEYLRTATFTSNGEVRTEYRCTTDGTLRMIPKPTKFSKRITASGEERCTDEGTRQVIKSEYFDDDKYSEYY